jgi:pyrimidine-specific ribonucleoside hydrolase
MSILRFTVIVALSVVATGACGDGGGSGNSVTPMVIDGDGAFDDIKAVMYLLEQPDVDVLAITMSGTGIGHCPDGAENTSAVLERIDAPEIPVACGRTTPLAGDNEAPPEWRAAADNLGDVSLPDPRPLADQAAPDLLAEAITSSDDDVTLVVTGPLTNIAEAVEADPSVLDRVEMLYLMGGAVDVGGNVLDANPAAEFNIWADPRAAAIVFATDVPITLVPLDATNEVPVTPYLYEAVAAHRDVSAVSQFVDDYLRATPFTGGLYQWDELAAVIATDDQVATFEDRRLAVEEEGGSAAGAIIDAPSGRLARVAVDADRDAFEDRFYEAIIGTADTGVPAWESDATLAWDGATCDYEGPDPLPDRLVVQIDNTGAELVALVTGTVEPGTTTADLEAYEASNSTALPEWWTPRVVLPASTGAHEVWTMDGGAGLTALCFVDPARYWQIAGPPIGGDSP